MEETERTKEMKEQMELEKQREKQKKYDDETKQLEELTKQMKEKPIIIFDDSLSAVDTETDRMIRKALKEKNSSSTVIIITHRITTAKQADRIVVLDNETISDVGAHEELASKPGLYQKMWDIQKKLEEEFKKVLGEEVTSYE